MFLDSKDDKTNKAEIRGTQYNWIWLFKKTI